MWSPHPPEPHIEDYGTDQREITVLRHPPTSNISEIYMFETELYICKCISMYVPICTLKVLRPYFLSPCRKWRKKGSSPRKP